MAATGIVFTHWIASSEAVWLRPIALIGVPRALVPGWLARLGRLSYGVYISHTVLILALHRALGGRGALPTEALLGLFPLVAAGAFVFAWMLRPAPGFRRAMP